VTNDKRFKKLVRPPAPQLQVVGAYPGVCCGQFIVWYLSVRAYWLDTLGHRFDCCPGHSLVELLCFGVLFPYACFYRSPDVRSLHFLCFFSSGTNINTLLQQELIHGNNSEYRASITTRRLPTKYIISP